MIFPVSNKRTLSPAFRPAQSLILLLLTFALGSLGLTVSAQTAPGIKTDLGVYPQPVAPPLPAAGGKFFDPTFGTEIMRVTDAADGAEGGTSYSYWPTFNRDNTRLIARTPSAVCWATLYTFDPVNFQLLGKEPLPVNGGGCPYAEDAIWSSTDADVLYLHQGARLYSYNVRMHSYSLVFDLSNRLPAGYSFFQMSLSLDDDTFACTLENAAYQVAGYLAYRHSTDQILYQSSDPLDEVHIDKTGRYLFISTGQQGPGVIQARVKDLQTDVLSDLTDDAPDQAPGHYDVGTGTIVGAGNYLGGLSGRSLATPHSYTELLDLMPEQEYGAYHVSMLADDEHWALLSFDIPTANGVFQNEIIQVATDGSARVRRLLHNHVVLGQYYDASRANISRDGRYIAFTSNWGVAGGRRDLFVARIEPAGSATPTPTPTPNATPTPQPTPTAAIQNVVWVDLLNSAATGNTLQKVAGCNGCADASAVALQSLAGDGYFEFTAVGTDKLRYAGLNPASAVPPNVAFAITLTSTGWAEVREAGAYKSDTPYQSGDVFRITVANGVVSYARNGTVFYRSTTAATYPLQATGVLTDMAASINNAVVGTNASATPTSATLAQVIAAQTQAATLAANTAATPAQIDALITAINQAYNTFLSEAAQFTAVDATDKALRTALYFTRAADALALAQRYPVSVQNRLQIAATRLAQARSLLPGGTTSATAGDAAHAPAAAAPPVIGSAVVVNSANLSTVIAPGSLAVITGDPTQSPLATQTAVSAQLSATDVPFELGSASVTIGGRAAQVFDVAPARITFCVPVGLPTGDAELLVTTQDGYVSRGTITIAPLAPGLFTVDGTGAGAGLVLNAANGSAGPFDVTTSDNLSSDKRTRLQLFAAGFSANAANPDTTNDVQLNNNAVLPNLAESVAVEARTSDGRVFQLPVEYAGAAAGMLGLDQVNVVLLSQLRGAGAVNLTLIVGGQRSNSIQIVVR